MLAAAIDWENLVPAGHVILGAILATVAVLRAVRHLVTMFDERPLRGRQNRVRRRDPSEPPDDDVTP